MYHVRTISQGDSGGGVISKNKAGKYEIVGIVSGGISLCKESKSPDVFTKVSSFVDWIKKIMIDN